MRFLVDQNISPHIREPLEAAGHDVVHVRDLSLHTADDAVLIEHARLDSRVIISSDTDFGVLLAAARTEKPSVILTRAISDMPAAEMGALSSPT